MKTFNFRTNENKEGNPFWYPDSFLGWFLKFVSFLFFLMLFLLLFCLPHCHGHDLHGDGIGVHYGEVDSTSLISHRAAPRDSIRLGTGDIQITLTWDTIDDLDLHCVDPSGTEIYFDHKISPTGGQLDVDMNARDVSSRPVENIYWPVHGAPHGTYTVKVHFYKQRTDAYSVPYKVKVKFGGKTKKYSGSISSNKTDYVTTFTY